MGKSKLPSAWVKSNDREETSEPTRRSRKTKGHTKPRPTTMASTADKHKLYQEAVQKPRKEVRNLDAIYRKLNSRYLSHQNTTELADYYDTQSSASIYRRHALSLREDFCGTAVLCAEWVRSTPSPDRIAYGIDIDASVIDYANHNTLGVGAHASSIASRVRLICADVNEIKGDDQVARTDIIASLNYAMCYFHKRTQLIQYLRNARANLNDFGLLFCDIFGGVEATRSGISNVREFGTFKYYFNQHSYDLVRNTIRFSLGFKMSDGSVLKNCFSYEFRVYSICELKEAMLEAGFDDVSVWISARHEAPEEQDENLTESEGEGDESDENDEGDEDDEGDESDESENARGGDEFEAFTELKERMEMPYSFNAYVIGIKLPSTSNRSQNNA